MHAVAGRPAALVSDKSVLEACIRDDALYKLTIFTFFTRYVSNAVCRLNENNEADRGRSIQLVGLSCQCQLQVCERRKCYL